MISDYLYEFVITARCGSVSKAAAELGFAQSVLSTHMSALEKELGTKLLERLPTGVRLTIDGRYVYESAKDLVEIGNQVKERFQNQAASGLERDILVGGLSSARRVTSAFEAARSRLVYSGYRLNVRYLRPESPKSIPDDLLGGALDVAVTFKSRWEKDQADGLRCVELYSEEPLAVVEKSHGLSSRDVLGPDAIANERFAREAGRLNNADDEWNEFVKECRRNGFTPFGKVIGYERTVGMDIEIPDYVWVSSPATSGDAAGDKDRFSVIPIKGISMSVVAVVRQDDSLTNRFVEEALESIRGAGEHQE